MRRGWIIGLLIVSLIGPMARGADPVLFEENNLPQGWRSFTVDSHGGNARVSVIVPSVATPRAMWIGAYRTDGTAIGSIWHDNRPGPTAAEWDLAGREGAVRVSKGEFPLPAAIELTIRHDGPQRIIFVAYSVETNWSLLVTAQSGGTVSRLDGGPEVFLHLENDFEGHSTLDASVGRHAVSASVGDRTLELPVRDTFVGAFGYFSLSQVGSSFTITGENSFRSCPCLITNMTGPGKIEGATFRFSYQGVAARNEPDVLLHGASVRAALG